MKALTVAALVVGFSLSGTAQEKDPFRTKHSAPERAAKPAPIPLGKSTAVGTASAANSRDLQTLEHQTARSSAPHAMTAKTPRAAAIKPMKDKSNPPIKLSGGTGNSAGLNHQGSNPYKGRLKQKYARH